MLRLRLLVGAGVLLFAGAANAACPSPFVAKDATSTNQNLASINDVNNNCIFPNTPNPCSVQIPNPKPISVTAATSVVLVPGASGKKTYICSLSMIADAADSVAVVEGTGSACGTSTAGVIGGTTALTGLNFGTNGGMAQGGGLGFIAATATAADDLCLITSSAGPLAGSMTWVQQ